MSYTNVDKRRAWFCKRYADNCAWVKQYKLALGCADCNYKEHHATLEFDHVPEKGGKLRGAVASQMGKSLRVIQEEIARCEVVCANCHQIRTWQRNQQDPEDEVDESPAFQAGH